MSDDLVKRLRQGDHFEQVMSAERAADRIEALRAEVQELALQVLASDGQAAESLERAEKLKAEALDWRAQFHNAQAENARLRQFAEECASYTCTCHEAYYSRGLVDPACMSGEIGYEAQEVLGLPVTCKGILAIRKRGA